MALRWCEPLFGLGLGRHQKQIASKWEKEAGMNGQECKLLKDLSYLDRAKVIELRLKTKVSMSDKIVEKLRSPFYSLSHALLSFLPVNEIVTTNYDDLYEMSCRAVNGEIRLLPYDKIFQSVR